MLSMNRELLVIVNPLRKRDIPKPAVVVDKPTTRSQAKVQVNLKIPPQPPTLKPKDKKKEEESKDKDKDSSENETNDDDDPLERSSQEGSASAKSQEESGSGPVSEDDTETAGAAATPTTDKEEDEEAKIAAEVRSGSQLSQTTSNNNAAKCTSCQCEKRLEALEGEISDLRSRMEGRKQLEEIISSWKEEVDKWMLSKFGFRVSLSSSGSGNKKESADKPRPTGTGQRSDVVICPTSGNLVERFFDEDDDEEEECISEIPDSPKSVEMDNNDTLKFSTEETVNVEITPDIFGHFLLAGDQEDYEQGQPEPEEILMDDSDSDEDDDQDRNQAGPSVKTRLDRQIIKMRADEEYDDDSNSDCYTVSDEGSDSEDSSSGDDYLPAGSRGRGKGSPQNRNSQVASTSGQSIRNTNPNAPKPAPARNSALLNPQTRKELLQHCKPKPGNLWECNVCGFMLASLENMLLHVKYNHSTSTHTCPYCRVVVLCRSPKDAALHQSTCKMRLPGSKVRTPKYSFVPTSSSSAKSEVPFKKPKVEDINAKVNKFIDDILDPNSKATAEILRKDKSKNSKSPAVVTLSSDEDD